MNAIPVENNGVFTPEQFKAMADGKIRDVMKHMRLLADRLNQKGSWGALDSMADVKRLYGLGVYVFTLSPEFLSDFTKTRTEGEGFGLQANWEDVFDWLYINPNPASSYAPSDPNEYADARNIVEGIFKFRRQLFA